MLGLFRRPRRPAPPQPRRIRPALEGLETRDCPSGSSTDALWYLLNTQPAATTGTAAPAAPSLTLAVTYNQRRNVTLSGRVSDAQPGGLTVTFTGKVTGSAVTDASGNYTLTADASALGTVTASVTDGSGLSASAQVTLSSNPPVISGFTATPGVACLYTFTGTVTDESPQGLVVAFGGAPVSLAGQSTVVDASGNFSFSITLDGKPDDNGTATAQTSDWWGLQSNTATVTISQPH